MADDLQLNPTTAEVIEAARRRTAQAHAKPMPMPVPPSIANVLDAANLTQPSAEQSEAAAVLAEARIASLHEHGRRVLETRAATYRNSLACRYHDARLSAFKPRNRADVATLEAARSWVRKAAAGEAQNLTLTGIPGTGKTWLLAAMGWALVPSNYPALYLRAPEGWAAVRATYGDKDRINGNSEHSLMSVWKTAPVLLLDEVGAGNITEPYKAFVAELICARTDDGLPTVAASNLPLAAMVTVSDVRTQDRLEGGALIVVPGPSRRLAA